jgi:predicted phosphatase
LKTRQHFISSTASGGAVALFDIPELVRHDEEIGGSILGILQIKDKNRDYRSLVANLEAYIPSGLTMLDHQEIYEHGIFPMARDLKDIERIVDCRPAELRLQEVTSTLRLYAQRYGPIPPDQTFRFWYEFIKVLDVETQKEIYKTIMNKEGILRADLLIEFIQLRRSARKEEVLPHELPYNLVNKALLADAQIDPAILVRYDVRQDLLRD